MCQPTKAPTKAQHAGASPTPKVSSIITGEIKNTQETQDEALQHGTLYGSLSLALIIAGFSLTMPHLQSRRDALQCDSLCYGSMTSTRSALSLVGGFFVSRLSDNDSSFVARTIGGGSGRKACLYIGTVASIVGLVIGGATFSILGMYLSMVPGALFQQNFSVLKALLADLHDAASSSTGARAGSVGKLGMSVGLAFMFGPVMGATLIKSFEYAVGLAIVLTAVSLFMVAKLPSTTSTKASDANKTKKGMLSFLDIKAARTPAAMFLMSVRVCMALAFHIYMTIWTVSLKQRFEFGPKDHGFFMSFIGLTYALAQGVVAKRVVKPLGPTGRIRVIQLCCIALGAGRYFAFHTQSLPIVYSVFACIITALGVLNTILTADTAGLASPDEVGGLYGVLESVESVAGICGPIAGGSLALIDPIGAPLAAVVGLYFIVFLLVTFGYDTLIIRGKNAPKKAT